jgi:hypothetical protein
MGKWRRKTTGEQWAVFSKREERERGEVVVVVAGATTARIPLFFLCSFFWSLLQFRHRRARDIDR